MNLTIREGETHAIMGPNGSGKSTLAYAIAGHPKYIVTRGQRHARRRGRAGDERGRARPGRAVPGHAVPGRGARRVGVELPAHRGDRGPRRGAEAARLRQGAARGDGRLSIDPAFAERNLNEGFSGGEKKRHEILQLELLDPKIAILDETDSGLDVDALKVVSEGINRFRAKPGHGVLLITHYTRILRYVQPDFVHVFVAGRIVEEGGPELAEAAGERGLRAVRGSGHRMSEAGFHTRGRRGMSSPSP